MARKTKKRREWSPHKYWTEHILQFGELWLTGEKFEKTINHRLAIVLLKRNGEKLTEQKVEKLAAILERGRNKAVDMLWESGLEVYVVGKQLIDGITIDSDYREDHFKRMSDMLGQRHVGVGRKSTTATAEERKNFGLPTIRELSTIKRHLLLGDGVTDVYLKQVEVKKVKIREMK